MSNLQSEVAKWSGVRPALSWGFFHCVNPKNEHGFTPLHMATINVQFLKYVNIVDQIKMAAIYGHFRNFQPCTSIFT